MPYTPLDPTADARFGLVLDDRSSFSQDSAGTTPAVNAGDALGRWSNLGSGGSAFDAVQGPFASFTLLKDGSGRPYAQTNAQNFKVPTSTALDALFHQTGNSGGNTVFAVFEFTGSVPLNPKPILVTKAASDSASGPGGISVNFDGGLGLNHAGSSYRPYSQDQWLTFATVVESGTSRAGGAAGYRDGATYFMNGSPSGKAGQPDVTSGDGHDLWIGTGTAGGQNFAGNLRALVVCNQALKPHEVLRLHRFYAARYGLPETLTDQPFALITDGNSETTQPQSAAYAGPVDDAAARCGIGLGASFMLGQSGRSTSDINADFAAYVAPLIADLGLLGVPAVYLLFEGTNDSYAASHYLDSFNLVSPTGAKFVAATALPQQSITPSYGASGNSVIAFNNQVVADAAAHGYTVARVGEDTTLGNWSSTDFADSLHWNATGAAVGAPILAAAVLLARGVTAAPLRRSLSGFAIGRSLVRVTL